MALPGISWLLLSLVVVVAVTPVPCTCQERARMAGSLLKCYPAPALTNNTNGMEFRASLPPLLGALPYAAAPTGYASLRSESDHAFVRGLCFGEATVPSECLRCLSAAVMNITAGCGPTSRRAGIWSAGCFLAYADTDTSSPREGAFRELLLLSDWGWGWGNDTTFYDANLHHMLVTAAQAVAQRAAAEISGARMLATAGATTVTSVESGNSSYYVRSKVWVVAQCARDGAAADCLRCLQGSARAVAWDLDAARGVEAVDWDLNAARHVEAAVVGFNCYLRFEVSIYAVSTIRFTIMVVVVVLVILALARQE